MKPHPRIRKTIKWGGLALTVVLVGVWVASGWWAAEWKYHGQFAFLARGRVGIALYTSANLDQHQAVDGASLYRASGMNWSPYFRSDSGTCAMALPIWIIAPITATSTGIAWRLETLARRRARLNLCPKCSYSRTGLAANAPCPECGTPAPAARA